MIFLVLDRTLLLGRAWLGWCGVPFELEHSVPVDHTNVVLTSIGFPSFDIFILVRHEALQVLGEEYVRQQFCTQYLLSSLLLCLHSGMGFMRLIDFPSNLHPTRGSRTVRVTCPVHIEQKAALQ